MSTFNNLSLLEQSHTDPATLALIFTEFSVEFSDEALAVEFFVVSWKPWLLSTLGGVDDSSSTLQIEVLAELLRSAFCKRKTHTTLQE